MVAERFVTDTITPASLLVKMTTVAVNTFPGPLSYNTGTYQFTVPATGVYIVYLQLRMDVNNKTPKVDVYINGAQYKNVLATGSSMLAGSVVVGSTVAVFSVGDVLELRAIDTGPLSYFSYGGMATNMAIFERLQ
jgi:hypothetical protein